MMLGSWGPDRLGGIENSFGGVEILGLILMIILWAAVITTLVFAVRALIIYGKRNGQPPTEAVPTASVDDEVTPPVGPQVLAILEERYAKGELTREEFLERKQDLAGC
jgi:uncharacterized membrane protein